MNNANKRILIVGGGLGQIPAIVSAQSMDLETLVVDRNEKAVGMAMADKALPIDILDIEEIVAAAKLYDVCGVMTMQSDIGVPAVGVVIDKLDLPGNGFAVAHRCSNKILTRQCFAAKNIPQPEFAVVASKEEALEAVNKIGVPCVIKSPDSSGSRGVVKVNSLGQIEEAFIEGMKYTRGGKLLVEEYIDGIEVGAQGFSIQGRCQMALVHDDILSPPPYMIPVGHAFPSSLDRETISRVEKTVKEAVDALGIHTGPSNIDLIIDKKGQARIIEIGARIGATCLPELVYYHTGIDWVKQTIKVSIDEAPELIKTKTQACAAFILAAPEDGIFQGYGIDPELENHPDVLEWEVTVSPGQIVDKLRKGTDRIGKVITQGSTQGKAIELAKKFRDSLSFDIRPKQ